MGVLESRDGVLPEVVRADKRLSLALHTRALLLSLRIERVEDVSHLVKTLIGYDWALLEKTRSRALG